MKSLTKITLLAAGLMAAAFPLVNAATADTASAPAGKHALAGKRPLLKALAERKALRQRVAQRLDLSADQKSQLKAKRAEIVASVKSIRSDTSLTKEQKRAKLRETLQAARADVRGSLTPDQQAKAGKLREFIRNKIKERRGL